MLVGVGKVVNEPCTAAGRGLRGVPLPGQDDLRPPTHPVVVGEAMSRVLLLVLSDCQIRPPVTKGKTTCCCATAEPF